MQIDYAGGKKVGKNTKLKNLWEGFRDWPEKATK
jgi:hypothetical protein